MSAERLNSVCLLHVHKEKTDKLDISSVIADFVSANDNRKVLFGV